MRARVDSVDQTAIKELLDGHRTRRAFPAAAFRPPEQRFRMASRGLGELAAPIRAEALNAAVAKVRREESTALFAANRRYRGHVGLGSRS